MNVEPGYLDELWNFADRIASEAGELALSYFRRDLAVELKGDNSPVTLADRETERLLRARIRECYPDHGFLGEETGNTNDTARFVWVVDPIDGTKSFIHGIPLFTVLVALCVDGDPVLGTIVAPAVGELVSAAYGRGFRSTPRSAGISQCGELADARLLVTDPGDLLRRFPRTDGLLRSAAMVRTWADGYGYLMVATGRAEIAMDPVMSTWDIACLEPIIREAGGVFSDLSGSTPERTANGRRAGTSIRVGTSALACATGRLRDQVVAFTGS